nr:nucleotide disphospho-sugar-binding domain-containing protein [Granulicella sp. dw_53]
MPLTGHLNPMTTLARRLKARGHEVVFFGVLDCGPIVRAAKLDFVSYCKEEYPVGSVAKLFGPVAKLPGLEGVRYTAWNILPGIVRATLNKLPEKLVETGVEALVLDTVYRFTELMPIRLGMPYAQIWNILHLDRSGATPPYYFSWPHETTPEALARNMEGVKAMGGFFGPMAEVAKAYAEKEGLQIEWSNPAATVSKVAVITQTPREFDFSGAPWPPAFHYAGPFHDEGGREDVPFAWERLTGETLVYASLGTLVNGLEQVFRTILEAVKTIPGVQLVLSAGSVVDLDELGPVPSNAIVVRKAPQIELLKRAALCITHAGLNTALESLAQGVPMVAMPIGFDQPGVASRIAYHGVGELVEVEDLTVEGLAGLIQKVLKDTSYRDKARAFQKVIAQTRGLDVAVDVLERELEKSLAGRPDTKRAELSHF